MVLDASSFSHIFLSSLKINMKRDSSDAELARQLQEAEGDDFEAYFDAFSKRQKTEDEESDTDENLFSIDPLGKYAFCK
jgi:hypothetical protein